MKAIIIIAACIILIRLLRKRTGTKPNRTKTETVYKIHYKPDRCEPEKEKLKQLKLGNDIAAQYIRREKQFRQVDKLRKEKEKERFNRYQAQCDKINLETELQELLRTGKGSDKAIREKQKQLEKAMFNSIEF